ncbi:MAG: coat protein [Cressdnaviricota sp.]|nr:MAG: coat protein [Cressdnaviricota sp.]
MKINKPLVFTIYSVHFFEMELPEFGEIFEFTHPQGTKRIHEGTRPSGTRRPRKVLRTTQEFIDVPEFQEQITLPTTLEEFPSVFKPLDAMQTEKKSNWKPPTEFVAGLSDAEVRTRYLAKLEGKGTKRAAKKPAKKRAKKYARRYSGYGGKYGGAAGGSIVYPNVIGRGAYQIKGGLNFGHEGDWLRGGLGGYYNSDPVVSGRGAYNIKRNSLWEGQGPPMIENITNGPVVIRHREYIGDMTCPTGAPSPFDIFFQQPINPGNPEMFPWLSQLAPMFQEWEAVGMIFEIKTMSSDYTSNVSMGTIFAAADYNVQATAPANKQQLENMEYSQSCKPSCSILMPIECSPSKTVATHLYIAPNLDYGNGDPQFYDLAQVFLGSQGLPNSGGAVGTIAELWVSYEIILYKPKISIIADSGEEAGFYIANPTVDSPLGTSTTVPFQGNQSPFITLDRFTQTVYLPPVPNQTYTIDYYLCADTMTGTVPDANIMHFTTTLTACTSSGETFYPSGGSSPLIGYFNSSTDTTVTGGTSQYEGYVQSQIVLTDATAGPNNIPSINFSEFSAWPTTMVNPNAVVIVQHTGLKFV